MSIDPPLPSDPAEAARIDHARLRRRMMAGTWREDLAQRMRRNLGNVRAEAIGEPDMSANPFEATCTGSSALYDLTPKIKHPDTASALAMDKLTTDAQLWPQMARNQSMTLAQRELLVKVSVSVVSGRPEVVYTPVYVDLALLDADPVRPSRPIRVRHAVQRAEPASGRLVWTYDEWDVRDVPAYRILASDAETDLSAVYGLPPGGLTGEAYPALRLDGTAILPFSTYHAAVTGYLLDPFYRRELVEGNLNVGVLWTFFGHCIRAASWPQRYLIGGAIASERTEANVRRIVADPATILEVLADPTFEGQPSAGQWGSASDPEAVAKAIGLYESRFVAYAGMDPADLQRISGDPRSGYALAVSQEGRIRAQRRYAPIFAPSDAETLAVTAALVNAALGIPAIAETGWAVEYMALPPSIEQQAAARTEVFAMLDKGLITKAEARARLAGEDLETATAALPRTPDTPLVGIAQTVTDIVGRVAALELPRDAGIALVARAYGITIEEATPLLGSAGAGFVPAAAAAAGADVRDLSDLALDALDDGDVDGAREVLRSRE